MQGPPPRSRRRSDASDSKQLRLCQISKRISELGCVVHGVDCLGRGVRLPVGCEHIDQLRLLNRPTFSRTAVDDRPELAATSLTASM